MGLLNINNYFYNACATSRNLNFLKIMNIFNDSLDGFFKVKRVNRESFTRISGSSGVIWGHLIGIVKHIFYIDA